MGKYYKGLTGKNPEGGNRLHICPVKLPSNIRPNFVDISLFPATAQRSCTDGVHVIHWSSSGENWTKPFEAQMGLANFTHDSFLWKDGLANPYQMRDKQKRCPFF